MSVHPILSLPQICTTSQDQREHSWTIAGHTLGGTCHWVSSSSSCSKRRIRAWSSARDPDDPSFGMYAVRWWNTGQTLEMLWHGIADNWDRVLTKIEKKNTTFARKVGSETEWGLGRLGGIIPTQISPSDAWYSKLPLTRIWLVV